MMVPPGVYRNAFRGVRLGVRVIGAARAGDDGSESHDVGTAVAAASTTRLTWPSASKRTCGTDRGDLAGYCRAGAPGPLSELKMGVRALYDASNWANWWS